MKLWGAVAVVVFALFALLAIATRHPAAAPKVSPTPARPMVQIVPGQIEARHTIAVELTSPVPIDELLVDVGQSVVEGQVIARLATGIAPDATAVALIAAQTRAAEAKTAESEAKLEAEKAKADAQRAKEQAAQARQVFEREQKLMDAGATPRKTLERAQNEFEAAQAQLGKVEEAWRQAGNRAYAMADQSREAATALEAAQKEDARGRARVAAAEIHAPATGTIVWRKGAEESKEIYRIATDPGQLRAVFPADKVKPGQEVLITVPGMSAAPIHAAVSAIENGHAIAEFTSADAGVHPGTPCNVSLQLK